jgi:hypothetical protein
MTVSVETARVRYAGDGVTINFPVPWYFLEDADLRVVWRTAAGVENGQLLGYDYFVVGAGDPAGGVVQMALVLPIGDFLAISRNEVVKQTAHYVDNDALPAATHEKALDRLTMVAAASKDRWTRALLLRETDTDSLSGGGVFQANSNRIAGVTYPVDDTDAATKVFVKDMISQALSGAPVDLTPSSGVAQWNANKLQSRSLSNAAPINGQVLSWDSGLTTWKPTTVASLISLLGSVNTWTNTNDFDAPINVKTLLQIGGGVGDSLDLWSAQARITGTFSDTPYSSRTLFKNRLVNKPTLVGAVASGAGLEAAWECFGNTDPNNAAILRMVVDGANASLQSNKVGTGVVMPLTVSVGIFGSMRFQTNGRVAINTTVDNGAQVNCNGFITRKTGAFRAHRNGVGYNVSNTTFTSPNFTTEEYDDSGWFDLATDRYVPQVAGKYVICGGNGPDAVVAAAHRHQTGLYKNGALHRLFNNQHTSGATGSTACGAAIVDANGSTDYFEIYVWHDFGGVTSFTGLAMDCFFEGAHIG